MAYRSLLIVSSLAFAAAARAADYTYVTIETPGADATYVQDINDSGVWAGYTANFDPTSPVGQRGVGVTGNADGSGIATFSPAGAYSIGASGINASGAVSGVSIVANGGVYTGTGFVRSVAGTYTDVSPTGSGITSAYSEAVDLNDGGMVVGFYDETQPTLPELNSGSTSHGFVLDHGVYARVDHPGGIGTQLYSVNNAGTAAGRYLDGDGNAHGFLYHAGAGTFDDYSLPGFDSFELGGLNGDGDFTAVAYTATPFGNVPSSFVHTGGAFVPFAVPGALATVAYGLNDRGQVVGVYAAFNPADPANPALHGFTATPVPEPASFAALAFGALALGRWRRKAPVDPSR